MFEFLAVYIASFIVVGAVFLFFLFVGFIYSWAEETFGDGWGIASMIVTLPLGIAIFCKLEELF